MFINVVCPRGPDPQDEDYNMLYVLNIDGSEILIRLPKVASCRWTLLRWRLIWIGIYLHQGFDHDDPRRAHAIELFKEALQTHGARGELDVPSNFHAEFEF